MDGLEKKCIVTVAQRCVSRQSLNISGLFPGFWQPLLPPCRFQRKTYLHHCPMESDETNDSSFRPDSAWPGPWLGCEDGRGCHGASFAIIHKFLSQTFRTAVSCHIQIYPRSSKVETLFFNALKRCFGIFGRHRVIFQVENRNARRCYQ